MQHGELDDAIRRALNILDTWNDTTGAVGKATSTYYELQSVIEDAVHCGAQAASGVFVPLHEEPLQPQPLTLAIPIPLTFPMNQVDDLQQIAQLVIVMLQSGMLKEAIQNRLLNIGVV